MFKWVRSIGRYGAKEAGSLLGAKMTRDEWHEMKDQATVVLNPFERPKGREETFQNAYRRLNLDEETLAKVYNNHRLRFYIALVFLVIALSVGGILVMSPHWWAGLNGVAAAVVCLAQMFNASFRAYQINHRKLVGVEAWWHAGDEWWPGAFVTLEEYQAKQARRAARREARLTLVQEPPVDPS